MSDASQWLMVKNLIFVIVFFISDDSAVSQRGRQTANARLEFDNDDNEHHRIGSDRIGFPNQKSPNCAPTQRLQSAEGLKVSLPPLPPPPPRRFQRGLDQNSAVISSTRVSFCFALIRLHRARTSPVWVELERLRAQPPPPTPWRSARSSVTSDRSTQTTWFQPRIRSK